MQRGKKLAYIQMAGSINSQRL